VAAEVEGEVLLEHVDGVECALLAGLGEARQCRVSAGDVRGVVLAVVQFHDLAGDVGLECSVVVRQVRECVVGHVGLLRSEGGPPGAGHRSRHAATAQRSAMTSPGTPGRVPEPS